MSEILIERTRGNIVESIHRGDVAVVNRKGELLCKTGDAGKYTFMRSAAKPVQAMNVILSGAAEKFDFNDAELAIMCGSHYAEKMHVKTVQSILKKIGLDKKTIQSGSKKPLSSKVAFEYMWEKKEDDVLFNDCSGKHAGMLAVCLQKGYSITHYTEPSHPLQREILRIISHITGYEQDKISIGIDGCSVPVHALPLYNMAFGYARLAHPEGIGEGMEDAASNIFSAMNHEPFMVSGTNGFCTDLIRHTNGKLIGKIGAEGIYCVGLKEQAIGVAVKIEDGSMNVLPPVVMYILKELDVLAKSELKKLESYCTLNNYNDVNKVVGKIRPAFNLHYS